jgi:hypothetical protein
MFRTARTCAPDASGEGDDEAHDGVALAQLDHVSGLERDLAAVVLVQRDPALTAYYRRTVRRPEVAQQVPLVARDDVRVLPRDVLVRQHHVVARGAPQADKSRRGFMKRSSGETLSDLQTNHQKPAYRRS